MTAYNEHDLDTLARTIYGEARGELHHPSGGVKSLHAVAWVIKNRAALKQYSSSIREVCTQSWQFSCWNVRDPNREILLKATFADTIFQQCYLAATTVLFGNIEDCTHGATHYHSTSIRTPYWAVGHAPTITIGHHVFYKL